MSNNDMAEFNNLVKHSRYIEDQPVQAPRISENFDSLKSAAAKLWAVSGDSYLPCEESVRELPAGHYIVDASPDRGVFFRKHDFSIDDLLRLPDSSSDMVIKQIEKFWGLESHFRKYGFLWKRGMLLWGPPGGGKTSALQIVANDMIKLGGIAVSVYSPKLSAVGLHILRKIEPKRPIIAIIEDIDAIVRREGEAEILALLDGEQQIDNVVYIATTNYPERLDSRIVNRPSRFDIIQKIGMPNEESRMMYLSNKSEILRKSKSELNKWVRDTQGFSIAHLKELIISVEVFQSDYNESLDRLKIMMECGSSSYEDIPTRNIGFGCAKQGGRS